MSLNRKQFKIDYQGRPLVLEISNLAGQANAAVIGRYGDTSVLVTAVMGKKEKEADYFPLVVDYEEKFYAAGKILGSRFVRREGRPSEEAILSGRAIDRTIRPLFDQRLRREVQVVVTILELDEENDPDLITLITTSAALAISDIPWAGPVAGVKLLKAARDKKQETRDGGNELIINPTNSQVKELWPAEGGFLSFVAGTKDRISMIELEGVDAKEKDITSAYDQAQKEIAKLIEWQEKIVKEVGKTKSVVKLDAPDESLTKHIKEFLGDKLEAAMFAKDKSQRETKLAEVKEALKGYLVSKDFDEKAIDGANHVFESEIDDLVHRKVLEEDQRVDGRKLDEVREIYSEVGALKRAHGSAVFMRGNTHALAITTLAPPGAEQLVDSIEFSGKRRFMLHYNFPPFSTGEVGRMGGPKRREIGHGALAEKAVHNLIPPAEEFPYVVRVVSEIVSSNGSSSMASVCGASLSLMDAGVPIKKHVAGTAMGLMVKQETRDKRQETRDKKQEPEYKVLTDIQGPEDHYGDMDFKVAGSAEGVRAIQMDVKIDGVTNKMLVDSLEQAKKARLEILKAMSKAIDKPRKETSKYAPKIMTMKINPERIGEVIGPGGKVINGIIAKTGALTIDIEQTGLVSIAGATKEIAEAAYNEVESIVKEYKVGDIVEGPIVKILDFGAIVQFGPNRDGMIHVSELKEGFVKKVEDVVKLGDFVRAKVVKVDGDRVGLSLKGVGK